MKDFGAVARCCCYCTDCCGGTPAVDGWDVTVSLTDTSLCNICDSFLSGTFNTSFNSGGCAERYDSLPINEVCNAASCTSGDPNQCVRIRRYQVGVAVYCTSATEYTITVEASVEFDLPYENDHDEAVDHCNALFFVNRWLWQKTVTTASFNCSTASGESIPFLRRECECRNSVGPCDPDVWLCADTPPAATLSAA